MFVDVDADVGAVGGDIAVGARGFLPVFVRFSRDSLVFRFLGCITGDLLGLCYRGARADLPYVLS